MNIPGSPGGELTQRAQLHGRIDWGIDREGQNKWEYLLSQKGTILKIFTI